MKTKFIVLFSFNVGFVENQHPPGRRRQTTNRKQEHTHTHTHTHTRTKPKKQEVDRRVVGTSNPIKATHSINKVRLRLRLPRPIRNTTRDPPAGGPSRSALILSFFSSFSRPQPPPSLCWSRTECRIDHLLAVFLCDFLLDAVGPHPRTPFGSPNLPHETPTSGWAGRPQ